MFLLYWGFDKAQEISPIVHLFEVNDPCVYFCYREVLLLCLCLQSTASSSKEKQAAKFEFSITRDIAISKINANAPSFAELFIKANGATGRVSFLYENGDCLSYRWCWLTTSTPVPPSITYDANFAGEDTKWAYRDYRFSWSSCRNEQFLWFPR